MLDRYTGVDVSKSGPSLPLIWRWDVFGACASEIANDTALMTIGTPYNVPLWRRIITRILLGSRWTRLS
jgi:hypothetical protein